MAALVRSLSRQGRAASVYIARCQPLRMPVVPILKQMAHISTSKKDKGIGVTVEPMEKSGELERLTKHFENIDKDKEENYTSYGYEPGDRDTDWFYHNIIMFGSVTIAVCWGGFIVAYMPDLKLTDWGHREAFLELERRERLGLPLVDPDYVSRDAIELPCDEDIGDQEIII